MPPAQTAASPRRTRPDGAASHHLLLGATITLVVVGQVMILSASSVESIAAGDGPYGTALGQLRYAAVGLVVLGVASRVPARLYRRWAAPAMVLALVLLLLVFTPLGLSQGERRSWIALGPLSGQPSEVLKPALALWLGRVLADRQADVRDWRVAAFPALPGAAVGIGLTALGHDVGTSLVLATLTAGALFVAGAPLRLFAVAGGGAVLAFIGMALAAPRRVQRITDWLGGDCDPLGSCYQTTQGLRALASGGWIGLGLGQSRQKWLYLPEAENDFIFAIIGEELGLAGTLLVLALLGVLAYAMLRVLARHTDPFARIVTGGVLAWIVAQALVNIGTVVGLAPVIGVPLPLVSAGGSALVTTLGALGVVLSFARTEPGVPEALARRGSVLRRSVAVLGRAGRR
ncbi:putative lipid II flippase FtsW [Cellulomonas triticagri]|uniref:putative lipid II flippase FtsW n=1 Tax=Cellulomonas triticagri TaxID=2483352 RepID=UPI001F433019|nr:putative lipid II flippase FtsW [Cellulomonas triticagri]